MKLSEKRSEEKRGVFTGLTVHFFSWPHILNLFEEVFIFQVYKFSHKNSCPVIIDCGSNIGVSILYFKKLFPLCRIIGFEPDDESFRLLEKNVYENNLQNVTLHNIALHSDDGKLPLYIKSETGSLNMSLMPGGGEAFSKTVTTKKLSDFIVEPVDLLKIDVEGSEINIINDLIIQNKMHLVRVMIIEYHPQITHVTPGKFIEKLELCGFEMNVMQNELHEFANEVIIIAKRI